MEGGWSGGSEKVMYQVQRSGVVSQAQRQPQRPGAGMSCSAAGTGKSLKDGKIWASFRGEETDLHLDSCHEEMVARFTRTQMVFSVTSVSALRPLTAASRSPPPTPAPCGLRAGASPSLPSVPAFSPLLCELFPLGSFPQPSWDRTVRTGLVPSKLGRRQKVRSSMPYWNSLECLEQR